MMNLNVSYLITVHNETETLNKLLSTVYSALEPKDEIIIIDDYSNNSITTDILKKFSSHNNVKIEKHALNNNYAEHKNFGNSKCKNSWVFQLDGDEIPPETLIGENLKSIIESNPETELIWVPRLNDVVGVTEEHAKQWGWRLSHSTTLNRTVIQWPDYQSRIYKNVPDRIKWHKRLHEQITGHDHYSVLPSEEEYAIHHVKTIEGQIQNNIRYNKLFTKEENMGI